MIKNKRLFVTNNQIARLTICMRIIMNLPKKPKHSHLLVASILVGLFACSSPEQTAKLIGKKASQKVTQFCLPNQVNQGVCPSNLEQLITPPSLSETITDKTEIISTW